MRWDHDFFEADTWVECHVACVNFLGLVPGFVVSVLSGWDLINWGFLLLIVVSIAGIHSFSYNDMYLQVELQCAWIGLAKLCGKFVEDLS